MQVQASPLAHTASTTNETLLSAPGRGILARPTPAPRLSRRPDPEVFQEGKDKTIHRYAWRDYVACLPGCEINAQLQKERNGELPVGGQPFSYFVWHLGRTNATFGCNSSQNDILGR